jgi:hypothetical protein
VEQSFESRQNELAAAIQPPAAANARAGLIVAKRNNSGAPDVPLLRISVVQALVERISGEVFSQILELREAGDGGGKLLLRQFLLRPISREFSCVNALLLNANFVLRDEVVEFGGE